MFLKVFLVTVLYCFISFNLLSQTTNTRKWRKSENDSMKSALMMIDDANYLLALPYYEKLYTAHPQEEFLKYIYGKCALYRSDKHEVALQLLGEVYTKNKKVDNIEYDLARANHFNYKFDEAIDLIDKCLLNNKILPETKKLATQLKQYCINGKELYSKPTCAKIENIGNIINSTNDEYVPIISIDESMMIFTYRGVESMGGLQNDFLQPDNHGKYFEDIFQSNKINGEWTKPIPVMNVNTNSHDGAIALSVDGLHLFIYRDSGDDHGDIYMSNFKAGEWTVPQKLVGQVNSYSWDGSCSMTADGKQLYFSSERAGGYGGKDIYRATLLPDSTWGNVVNLGDSINTAFDDDAPFIHPDGVTLFYSSKGKNSMGGYDIFQSRLNWKDSTFSKPLNLGYPINTPDDDIYYILSANAERGYYASGKSGGQGLKDIYTVSPGYVGNKPAAYVVKGKIKADGNPAASTIFVEIIDDNNKKFGEYSSSPITGNYMVSLPSGGFFKLTYKYKSYPFKTLEINTTKLENFEEKVNDVNFDSLEVSSVTLPKKDSVAAIIMTKEPNNSVKNSIAKKSPVKNTDNDIQQKTKEYAIKNGNVSKANLIFKVQIAAYKFPKNYKYDHLIGLGDVENLLLKDGITRITIGGEFSTLSKALEHNEKVINAGQTDAFVTIIYEGERIYLEDLEKMGVFVK